MKLFIKKTLLFILSFALFIAVVLFVWMWYYSVPAPNLSNSYSFNEKMLFIEKNYPPRNLDVLALGSSMSLNNLHTETVVKKMHTEKYLNCASWGQNMEEDFKLLKIVDNLYHPKKLIISTTYFDFAASEKIFKYSLIDDYLQSKPKWQIYYYLKNFSLSYLMKEAKNAFEIRNSINDYEYLGYDTHGGINFTSNHFNITPKRWDGDSISAKLDSLQYKYLDSISSYCTSKNITLYVIQNPFREGYKEKLTVTQLELVAAHNLKIETILKRNEQTFVDTSVKNWPDNLFVDYCHLNNNGAQLVTEFFFEKIAQQQDSTSVSSYTPADKNNNLSGNLLRKDPFF